MARGKDIEAAAAYVRLYVNGAAFTRGLNNASRQLDAFGTKMRTLGSRVALAASAMSVPLIAAFKSYVDIGSELQDVSDRTGVAVRELSELRFAADQTGASIEDLEKAFRKSGITSAVQFEAIADKLASTKDPAKRIEMAMSLMGKSGAKLIPLLSMGAKGIREMRTQALRLGLSFSDKAVAKAEEMGDKIAIVGKMIQRVFFSVGAALEPIISPLTDQLALVLGSFSKWINENPGAVRDFAKGLVAIAAAGAGMVAVGVSLQFVAGVLASIATLIAGGAAFAGGAAAIAGGGALGVGLGVLAQKVIGLTGTFRLLKSIAVDAWKGVVAAITGNEIGLAIDILKKVFQVAWTAVELSFREMWSGIINFVSNAWDTVLAKIEGSIVSLVAKLPALLGGGQDAANNLIGSLTGDKGDGGNEADPRIQGLRDNLEKFIMEFDKLVKRGLYLDPKLKAQLPNARLGLADFEEQPTKGITTSGTFNPFALRSIVSVGPAERTAKATEKTAKHTKKLELMVFH